LFEIVEEIRRAAGDAPQQEQPLERKYQAGTSDHTLLLADRC
jgi:hypothetical protein